MRMLKILLKKQLKEVGAFMFYDAKKGKRRTKGGIIGYSFLMAGIFVMMCAIFGGLASLFASTFFELNLGWMYYAFMGIVSVVMGVFGSVFNTFASVYLAKDNELMLSMPIKKSDLLIARLFGVYFLGTIYMLMVYVPTLIIGWVFGGFTLAGLVGQLVILVVLSLIVLSLSALLGWGVAIISTKLKNKSFVTVFISLAFFGAYYYFYFKASANMSEFLSKADDIAISIKDKGFILYHLGNAGMGNALSLLIQVVFASVVTALVYALLSKSFTKILTMNKGEKRVEFKGNQSVQTSVDKALFKKEFKKFTSSSTYMLNCSLGGVFTLVGAIAMLIKAGLLREIVADIGIEGSALVGILACTVAFTSAMNDISEPSVSLEGKNIWILQSLPVDPWRVLNAKLKVHLYVSLPPVLIYALSAAFVFNLDVQDGLILILLATAFVYLTATDGLMVGLKMPNLHWTNEAVALKQSAGVAIAMFGNWLLVFAIAAISYFVSKLIGIQEVLIVDFVIAVIVSKLIEKWLRETGSNIFANLN